MKNYLDNIPLGDGKYIRIDEIIALQTGWQALEKVLSGLGEAFVISGCVVSGTAPNNAVSEGVVILDGKLHTLPAVASVDLSTTKYIKFLSNTASDSRPLFGGGTSNTYETYLAQVSATAGVAQSIAISQGTPAKTILDVVAKQSDLTSLLATISTRVNTAISLASGWIDIFGSAAKYNKNYFGMVKLAGAVKYTGGGTVSIATLPSGYRPSIVKQFQVAGYDASSNPIVGVVEVEATGNIELISPSLQVNQYLYLDSISFYTDM